MYILFSNLLFKMCISISEYVIHAQIQNSKRAESSTARSKSFHPVCQHLVPSNYLCCISFQKHLCIFKYMRIYSFVTHKWSHIRHTVLYFVLLHFLYHGRNIFCMSLQLFQQHLHYVDGLSSGNQSPNSDYLHLFSILTVNNVAADILVAKFCIHRWPFPWDKIQEGNCLATFKNFVIGCQLPSRKFVLHFALSYLQT